MAEETQTSASNEGTATLNKEQISKLKAQYKEGIFQMDITHPETEKVHTAYFRKPNRKDISRANKLSNGDALKMNEDLLTNCWIGGDATIKTDDDLFFAAAIKIGESIKIAEATLKKL